MKIHAVAALISLLYSLPGALSANVRDGRTSERKLGKADDKKIQVAQPPPLPGIAPGDKPKVLIGFISSPKDQLPFDLYKKLEDVCEIEVVISYRPFFEKTKSIASSLYAGEYHAVDNIFVRAFAEGVYEFSAPIFKVCISLFNRCVPKAYCCRVEFGF